MLRDINNKKKHFVIVGKGGGGGIEQVQSDWAQTDNTQPDYIKNKPEILDNTWFGTQAEFDALVGKNPNIIYYIEDANGSVVHNNKNYGTKVKIEEVEPSPFPEYLTATYFVPNPTDSLKILDSTANIAGYRIKGATTWETPAATIAVSNYGELVIEYNLTDNTTLQGRQFSGCSRLVKIELPTSITTIGYGCFFYSGLIDYPDMTYVTTAGGDVFFSCPIKSMGFTINDNVTRNYDYAVFNGLDNTDVIDKVYVNGKVYAALFHTENNGDIDLTNGIDGLPFDSWIMYGGHMRYNLNSLKFPSTLQYLAGRAFARCTVTNLYFYSTTPPINVDSGATIFDNSNITNIYVPAEALTAYQNSPDFADVVSKIQAMP